MVTKGSYRPLAMIYAQALYEAAEEAGLLAQVQDEMAKLKRLVQREAVIETFFVSPTVSFDEKRKLVETSFAGFSQTVRNFLLVLIERNRATLLESIAEAFADYANRRAGVATLQVHSARPLQSDEKQRIAAILQKRLSQRIEIQESVRPELLGGMVVIHEDKMWDASLSNRIRGIVEKMDALKLEAVKWTEDGAQK